MAVFFFPSTVAMNYSETLVPKLSLSSAVRCRAEGGSFAEEFYSALVSDGPFQPRVSSAQPYRAAPQRTVSVESRSMCVRSSHALFL